MKSALMKANLAGVMVVVFLSTGLTGPLLADPKAGGPEEILPLIEFSNAPLADVIRILARQMGQNLILDPRIVGPNGQSRSDPRLTFRWRNITANEALQRVLKDYKLTMTT